MAKPSNCSKQKESVAEWLNGVCVYKAGPKNATSYWWTFLQTQDHVKLPSLTNVQKSPTSPLPSSPGPRLLASLWAPPPKTALSPESSLLFPAVSSCVCCSPSSWMTAAAGERLESMLRHAGDHEPMQRSPQSQFHSVTIRLTSGQMFPTEDKKSQTEVSITWFSLPRHPHQFLTSAPHSLLSVQVPP